MNTPRYTARLSGGPKDGWRYDLQMVQHEKTWEYVPATAIVVSPGTYHHVGRDGDDELYAWNSAQRPPRQYPSDRR